LDEFILLYKNAQPLIYFDDDNSILASSNGQQLQINVFPWSSQKMNSHSSNIWWTLYDVKIMWFFKNKFRINYHYVAGNMKGASSINGKFCCSRKEVAHCVMALPNVIWPWSIFYSKDQLLRKENKESLGRFFFEIEYSKLINFLGDMC
jgi:hypothetical protein